MAKTQCKMRVKNRKMTDYTVIYRGNAILLKNAEVLSKKLIFGRANFLCVTAVERTGQTGPKGRFGTKNENP